METKLKYKISDEQNIFYEMEIQEIIKEYNYQIINWNQDYLN
jgi:hypothetical protein